MLVLPLTLGLSFLEGFALILSPCILPILPIILAGSLSGSKKRPIGIMLGFILFFSLFTFFSRQLVQYSGVDVTLVRQVAYGILFFLGIVMVSSYLTDKFNLLTQHLLNVGTSLNMANDPQGGLLSGIIFGGLVALIWTPCAGPILAAVIVQTVIQQTNFMGFLTLLVFGIGVAVPMLIIILCGRKVMTKLSYFKLHAGLVRKLLGLIIMASVGYLIFPATVSTAKEPEMVLRSTAVDSPTRLINGLAQPYRAPNIMGIDHWINSKPLTMEQLKGKVVLIDFWTYSCINCLRTLPYIKSWYQKYHDKGLVIIGIHAPEFEFEKNLSNVQHAVTQLGITYPVALDNDFLTWRSFNNSYWPAHYLIDKQGDVVYTHFGEGEYDVTENNIRYLLGLNKSGNKQIISQAILSAQQTPETYLGYARAANFASSERVIKDSTANYTIPKSLLKNQWALDGSWAIMPDKIISTSPNANITIHVYAQHVYMVAGNDSNKPVIVTVMLNGKEIRKINIDRFKLYDVIDLGALKEGIVKISTPSSGLELYTFTFG